MRAITTLRTNNDQIVIGDQLGQLRIQLERWGEISRLMVAACDLLQACFGAQILLSLYTVTLYYIMFMYQVIVYFIKQELLWGISITSCIFTLLLYMFMKFIILWSGQCAQNETDELKANLATLHNLLLTKRGASENARAARALLQQLRAAPLRVRLLRELPVRATLIADMLAVALNYTIILLQFNHVV